LLPLKPCFDSDLLPKVRFLPFFLLLSSRTLFVVGQFSPSLIGVAFAALETPPFLIPF